jgi:DNA-binding GntR family transcriptional regulator
MRKDEPLELAIRRDIMEGALPPASRLKMEDLKVRFDAGFSPIREALSKLVGEGLVEFETNRGFRVTPLTRQDLADIAVARRGVEIEALRMSMLNGDDRWEAGVVSAIHLYRRRSEGAFTTPESLRAWEEAHDGLHAAMIAACGSSRLLSFQRQLQDQHLRYRRLIVVPEVSPDAHVEEHERLVALVLARDVEGALEHASRHLMITVDVLQDSKFWERQQVRAG